MKEKSFNLSAKMPTFMSEWKRTSWQLPAFEPPPVASATGMRVNLSFVDRHVLQINRNLTDVTVCTGAGMTRDTHPSRHRTVSITFRALYQQR